MKSYVSDVVKELPPSGIRKFFDIATEIEDAISLGVGEPDFVTPWNIREAAIHCIDKGRTHYTSNRGMTELRELIEKYLMDRFKVSYSAKNMVITVGASEALDLAFRAICNPGDEILIPAPSYVSYEPGVKLAGGVPVAVETFDKDAFILTPEELEKAITPKTKAIVVPYPNNPTGAIMTREQLDAIVPLLRRHNILILADEIYAELTYGGNHASIAKGNEDMTVLINGFSKAFAMTGWRLGYAAGPKEIIDAMVKIHQYSMLCAPIMSQAAGIEALSYEMGNGYQQVEDMRRSYNRRRTLILDKFSELGLPCFEPKGAFYAFPNVSGTGLSSEDFCTKLLYSKSVAVVPGTAFGKCGAGFVRFSYAASVENIVEAMRRIGEFLEEL